MQREILGNVYGANILERKKRGRVQMTLPVNKLVLTITPPYVMELGRGC